MITWMQRHRKATMITMWVAVITFIGAGAVDWGNASYGSKATSIGKVGQIELKGSELNQVYSSLYSRYNEMFGGKLDKDMAKKLRLEEQALESLIQQAQLLNLAALYEISVSQEEIAKEIVDLNYFHKEGRFDKDTYTKVLKSNNLTVKAFEESIKKSLLLQRVTELLTSKALNGEETAFETLSALSDKVRYEKITTDSIDVPVIETDVKAFWELNKNSYMTQATITVEELTQASITTIPSDEAIKEYYDLNSLEFQNDKGELEPLEAVKKSIIETLNKKETKTSANRLFIAWKKEQLPAEIKVVTKTFTQEDAPYDMSMMQEIMALPEGGLLKAREMGDSFVVVKLVKIVQPRVKSYEEARAEVAPSFVEQEKRNKLQAIANARQTTFQGTTTDFITLNDTLALSSLSENEAKAFLKALFTSKEKTGQIAVSNDTIILYEVVAQKLLFKPINNTADVLNDQILQVKEQARQASMLNALKEKYPTEMFN